MGKTYSTHVREKCIRDFVGKPEEKRHTGEPKKIIL
jgi:hypothetical protein